MEFNLTIQFQMELKQCIQIGCCAKTLVFNFGLKNDFIFHLDKNLANVYIYIQNAAEINSIPLAIQAKVRQAHCVTGNKIQSRSSDPSWRKTACAETCSGTSAANSTQI